MIGRRRIRPGVWWLVGALIGGLGACDGWGTDPTPVVDAESVAPGQIVPLEAAPSGGLQAALAAELPAARAGDRVPFLLLTSPSCPHCTELMSAMDHPAMQDAIRGTTLIRLDIERTSPWIEDPALSGPGRKRVPSVHVIEDDGSLGPLLTGDAWGDDTPESMAPVLGLFVRGHGVPLAPPEAVQEVAEAQGVQMVPLIGGRIPEGAVEVPANGPGRVFMVPDGTTPPATAPASSDAGEASPPAETPATTP